VGPLMRDPACSVATCRSVREQQSVREQGLDSIAYRSQGEGGDGESLHGQAAIAHLLYHGPRRHGEDQAARQHPADQCPGGKDWSRLQET
jgi:hypothetical protein